MCHNEWASNILIVMDTSYAGIHHSKYWMPIHYDTIEDGQNKKSHLSFSKSVTHIQPIALFTASNDLLVSHFFFNCRPVFVLICLFVFVFVLFFVLFCFLFNWLLREEAHLGPDGTRLERNAQASGYNT